MNVLFVGNYRDGTGWAHGAIEYIQSLDAVGINVSCRPIKLSGTSSSVSDRIVALERTKYAPYDAVIQNVLPHYLDFNATCGRNIALYYTETSNLGRTRWSDHINTMDSAWVACGQSRTASMNSGVTIPVDIVPIPCDTSKYTRSYKPLRIRDELADSFIFYTIGEFNRRKNLRALLTAFHTEFDINEPVSLLIKTTPRGTESPWDAEQGVRMFCDSIKQGLKIFDKVENYKSEIVLAGRYSDHEMMRLHTSCDCGVFPSYGEAWCMPAFDSMAMGKTPIVTEWGGFMKYMHSGTGWLVRANMEPVTNTHLDTFPDLHTAYEEWAAINIADLRSAMRRAFEDTEERRRRSAGGLERSFDFSHQNVGRLMKELLK